MWKETKSGIFILTRILIYLRRCNPERFNPKNVDLLLPSILDVPAKASIVAVLLILVFHDMSSTTFIEPLPVIEFVTQLLNRDAQSRPLSDADRVKIKKALRGVKVEVTHRGNMRRKYRISGLISQATRELTFPVDERGTVKSVVQNFQETYGFTI